MAQRIILFWRDIPTQVLIRAGRTSAKRELPPRFMEAVDMAAMRAGARDSDAYLEDWRKSDPEPCGDDLDAEADAALAKLDGDYPQARIVALVKNHGREPNL